MIAITRTRHQMFPRIRARIRAAHLKFLIAAHEEDAADLLYQLEVIPPQLDVILGHIAELRVQLALAERES